MEVLRPGGIGRWETEGFCEYETEAAIEERATKQRDGRLVQGVGGRKDTVHQSCADAAALMGGQHANRPRAQGRTAVDACAAAHHMADDVFAER